MSEKPYPLATRMKEYEFIETEDKFNNEVPLICRVDGRSFSKFCKRFTKPYDADMSNFMKQTTKFLLHETKADLAYHQSDEISLLFKPVTAPSSRMFDGKKVKLNSVIAGMTSSYFMREVFSRSIGSEKSYLYNDAIPHFDCRIFEVPNIVEAGNYFVWRQQDAKRNSISMMAQSIFSHKELQGKSGIEMLKMISDSGNDYDGMPFNFKYGSFFAKETIEKVINGEQCLRTEIKEYDVETITYKLDYKNEYYNQVYNDALEKLKTHKESCNGFFTDEQIKYCSEYEGDITCGDVSKLPKNGKENYK